eukprot:1409139-Rhodomonas_salina.1
MEVSVNGIDYSRSGVEVHWVAGMLILPRGPQLLFTHGGTVSVELQHGAASTANLLCKVGESLFAATVSSNSLDSLMVECVVPPLPAGEVELRVVDATDRDFTSNSVAFTVLDAPSLHSLLPSRGASSGGSLVTVVGSGFVMGLDCSWWSTDLVSSDYISSSLLACQVPAARADGMSLAALEVGVLGSGFTTSGLLF